MTNEANKDSKTPPVIIGRKKTPTAAKSALEQQYPSLNSDIKNVYDSLVSGSKVRNTLPEEVFKNYFLQMFAGFETHPDVTVGMWISIAGTPFAEVDIVDNSGQVIFTVPPIFERNIVDPTKQSAMPLSVVTDTVEKLINQSPYRAMAFLKHQLGGREIKDEVIASFQERNFSRMDSIFERYSITPVWADAQNAKTTKGVVNNAPKSGPLAMSTDEDIL